MLCPVGVKLHSLLLCYYEGLNLSYKLIVIVLVGGSGTQAAVSCLEPPSCGFKSRVFCSSLCGK